MLQPLWTPSHDRIEQANITAFSRQAEAQWNISCPDYQSLYQWSIDQPEQFWQSLWTFSDVIAETRGDVVLEHGKLMPGANWFPQARLNYAENLLRHNNNDTAIVFWGEDKITRSVSWAELNAQVSRLAQALKAVGITQGDHIAGYMPNIPETIIAMLATTSIGAVWCSCSPDFGAQGMLDRVSQIKPKVLFTADGYFYNGKQFDSLSVVQAIAAGLPSLQHIVVVPYVADEPKIPAGIKQATTLDTFIDGYQATTLQFTQLAFAHPLFIMFSSGTTGIPKCIVHSVGGTLLQHLKEHQLHADIKPADRLFYFTTCGWMMWNWLVSGLASTATIMLYDGSPFHPDANILFDYADAESISHFGVSAKFIDAINKAGLDPASTHKLDSLRTIFSTGSTLTPESFDFVYNNIKRDVCLSSISGGTDILSCFAVGNPTLPVYQGELQCRALGMKVEVFDEDGQSVVGKKGELVCTTPFPSMPTGFWNDPDNKKYLAAYFEKYPGVWSHGDFVELTTHNGLIIYGRSDTVLNPGGVRIGTAEIYRQIERVDEVLESLVIGQEWQDDIRIVLFVILRDRLILNEDIISKIRQTIRSNTTARHLPAKIIQVNDIPRTKSGKIMELAVRNVVHNQPVTNKEVMANPQSLALFKNIAELKS